MHDLAKKTTAPVEPGDFTAHVPEFGRTVDLQKCFGIRRGTAYALLKSGKIKGVLLRVQGAKSGVRLFEIESVRKFIRTQMERGTL